MVEPLQIFQHNLGRGRAASGELLQQSLQQKARVLLLQEPSTIRQTVVCGLGTTSNRILTGSTTTTPLACIVITDPTMDVLHLTR